MGTVADFFSENFGFGAGLAAYFTLLVTFVGLCLAGLWRRVG
jgi:hypothetical protein